MRIYIYTGAIFKIWCVRRPICHVACVRCPFFLFVSMENLVDPKDCNNLDPNPVI